MTAWNRPAPRITVKCIDCGTDVVCAKCMAYRVKRCKVCQHDYDLVKKREWRVERMRGSRARPQSGRYAAQYKIIADPSGLWCSDSMLPLTELKMLAASHYLQPGEVWEHGGRRLRVSINGILYEE